MMTSPPLGRKTNLWLHLHFYVSPTATKLATDLILQMMMWWRDEGLWFYLRFYKPYDNQTGQDGRPVSSDFILQVLLVSLLLGHVTNLYGFTSTSMRPIATQLDKINQYTVTLNLNLLSHVTNIYGFISNLAL